MKLLTLISFAALVSILIWRGIMATEETRYRIYATSSKKSTVASLDFIPPDKLVVTNERVLGHNPNWITFDEKGKGAYVMGDNISFYTFENAAGDEVYDTSATAGKDEFVSGCIVRGLLFIANYVGGSVTVRPIKEHDKQSPIAPPMQTFNYTREGIGPVTSRQDKSYAHDAIASPDEGWVYICDLGSDEVHHIKVRKGDHADSVQQAGSTSVAQGSGPRHLRFFRDEKSGKQFAYLASELSCTVTAFSHDPQTGNLNMIGHPLLTVPKGVELGGTLKDGPQRTTAEVAISPDGHYLYVSNRGDEVEDHITVFKRNSDGSLAYHDWYATGGIKARHFSLSHDGKYLAVAHETSGSIAILKRDKISGSLSKTGAVYKDLPGTQYAGFFPPQEYV